MDYKEVIPVVKQLTGIEDLATAVRFYEGHKDLVHDVVEFFKRLFVHTKTPAVAAPPVPVLLAPPPPPAISPINVTLAGDDVTLIVGKLSFVELAPRNSSDGQRGEFEALPRFKEIQQGANIDDGSWLHCNLTPYMPDGSELAPGDPRWAMANKWAPNGAEIWLYYEWNGKSTLDGHHSEFVEPGSVADDHGCTPTYKITAAGQFRFGFQYKRRDGIMLDTGLIGLGNERGGRPFNIA